MRSAVNQRYCKLPLKSFTKAYGLAVVVVVLAGLVKEQSDNTIKQKYRKYLHYNISLN